MLTYIISYYIRPSLRRHERRLAPRQRAPADARVNVYIYIYMYIYMHTYVYIRSILHVYHEFTYMYTLLLRYVSICLC